MYDSLYDWVQVWFDFFQVESVKSDLFTFVILAGLGESELCPPSPDKKTKQNDAEVSEEEDPEQSAKQKIKKLRRDAGLDVEEIDEDEELQMLQALELEEQGELSIEETAPVATSKRKSSQRDKAGAPPPPPVCSPVKKQRHSLSTPAVSTSASLPSAVPSSPKITAATSSSAQKLIQGGGNDARAQPEEELRLLEGWGKCRPFLADEYCSTEANSPFCPPTTLAKEVQKSKWIAEIVKLKPFVAVLERTLAVDSVKWKQTDVQNAIKALNKITNKTDRKLEFEASVASKEEPALSQRTSSLKEAFEAVKTLKDLAIVSGKSCAITQDSLFEAVEKVEHALFKLISTQWVGFPLFWVQAGWLHFIDSQIVNRANVICHTMDDLFLNYTASLWVIHSC